MKTGIVIVGHGSGDEALSQYMSLLEMLRNKEDNAYLVMLHGEPSASVVADELVSNGIDSVKLVPILLARGHHMSHNIVSSDSLIHKEFTNRGITVDVVNKGLLDYVDICKAIVDVIS